MGKIIVLQSEKINLSCKKELRQNGIILPQTVFGGKNVSPEKHVKIFVMSFFIA